MSQELGDINLKLKISYGTQEKEDKRTKSEREKRNIGLLETEEITYKVDRQEVREVLQQQ